ncbi:MAG: leucine--tRNA ligase [Candidatus Thermoplasmatota archaeon]
MDIETYNYTTIEKKWQEYWYTNHINTTSITNQKKFFIHFAYPGVSGYLHVGHMRGFTYCDIIARYKKMTGHDILFPAGFHASGIPSIAFAKKVERNDPDTIAILKKNNLAPPQIEKLKDPHEVVKYFSTVYIEDYWKRFGFLIDYTRTMTTISPGYKRFIQWQFHKLNEKKLLIQKPHYAPFCPNCGPVAVDKSETDVSKGGSAEILEFTIIKFRLADGTILPAATLRPETIFGVTNMWINPDVVYQKVKIHDEIWICSQDCIEKLMNQYDAVEPLPEKIPGKNLLHATCTIPMVERAVPILPGIFADPHIATGIVMSVPAHAPYDWIALVESGESIPAIKIIDVDGFGDNPAKEACEQLGIISQTQTEKLDEATDLVYKKEFHTGVLNEKCPPYQGLRISNVKDTVIADLIDKNVATIMREFSEEVLCRCAKRVVIKQIPDQWFIKYSDVVLTEESKKYAATMQIYPSEYYDELPKILDWFGDRAVIRKGNWLGTEFPFKKGWIIEPISDSTLYPAYYVIAPYVNAEKITAEEMTPAFFDYVFLGLGKPKNQIWKQIKQDFDYFYPVDINLGGKEHKTVHFPVYIMNHVAIMPEHKRPQGLFVHWWVTQKGKEKISKSKGGAEPILEAATAYGVDAMRLYYAHVGSPFVDIEWDPDTVLKYKNRIQMIYRQVMSLLSEKHCRHTSLQQDIDHWLLSIFQRRLSAILNAFETYDLRVASNEIFFECYKDLQWYLKRGGDHQKTLSQFLETWIILMTPITPHLAEELWEKMGNQPCVSEHLYPSVDTSLISEIYETGEYLLTSILEDIGQIMKVTQITPQKILLYTTPVWKTKYLRKALHHLQEKTFDPGTLIKEALSDPLLQPHAKQVSQYLGKLASDLKKFNDDDRRRHLSGLDEFQYLKTTQPFLERFFACRFEIYQADDPDKNDPMDKARYAAPLKPAIVLQ